MERRLERVAKNETVFRAVNREIERASEEARDADLEVLCECGAEGCQGLIGLPASEYERVHGQRDRFVVLPGHDTSEIERVVERTDRYVIVDKIGEAERIAEDA